MAQLSGLFCAVVIVKVHALAMKNILQGQNRYGVSPEQGSKAERAALSYVRGPGVGGVSHRLLRGAGPSACSGGQRST
ncbi:MAG TPA: hypothetical protein DCQ70_02800 [Halieaceae bacterium]|nr:hypothetical protein [Halieaceae bacterium]